MNKYKPLPREPVVDKERTHWTGFMITIIIFIGVIFAFGLVISHDEPSTCDEEINESFINGTRTGYQQGVLDTSNFVLETGLLPVFYNGQLQYLNLTKEEK